MINFYQIISPFYHHYNWFYTIMIIDDHPKMAILHHRIPTRHPGHPGHPGGIRPPPHRRTSPRPWRWRPRRSSHARRSGTIAPGHLALRRDPERPRITRILRFVMNCYVLLTCYKKLLSPSPVGFCWPEFLFLKKNWLITWNTRTKDIGNSSANNRVRWCLRNPVRTQTLVVKLST